MSGFISPLHLSSFLPSPAFLPPSCLSRLPLSSTSRFLSRLLYPNLPHRSLLPLPSRVPLNSLSSLPSFYLLIPPLTLPHLHLPFSLAYRASSCSPLLSQSPSLPPAPCRLASPGRYMWGYVPGREHSLVASAFFPREDSVGEIDCDRYKSRREAGRRGGWERYGMASDTETDGRAG